MCDQGIDRVHPTDTEALPSFPAQLSLLSAAVRRLRRGAPPTKKSRPLVAADAPRLLRPADFTSVTITTTTRFTRARRARAPSGGSVHSRQLRDADGRDRGYSGGSLPPKAATMTRLILSTSNIMSGGPSFIRKPGIDRSNLELTNSLRRNFLAAQQDYSPPLSDVDSPATKPDALNGDAEPTRPAPSVWTSRDGADLYIPTIDWSLSGLAEEASQYEITAKLFFLPGRPVEDRAAYARAAVTLVLKELGVPAIDLLIVSFPGMSFEGDCAWEADKRNGTQGHDADELATWAALTGVLGGAHGLVRQLGIAEFGSEKLARFLHGLGGGDGDDEAPLRRPAVDQINVKDCCNVPPPLVALAKREGITLLTHSDCTDILPPGTLRELLGQSPRGAGLLSAESKRAIDGMKGDVLPSWVIKYTAVVRDRGVVENKGYFAAAELRE